MNTIGRPCPEENTVVAIYTCAPPFEELFVFSRLCIFFIFLPTVLCHTSSDIVSEKNCQQQETSRLPYPGTEQRDVVSILVDSPA